MSYLFYDVETTGLNEAFDQILRFGYVRTSEDLEETDRGEIAVRLRADVTPAPRAVLTHRLGIRDMVEEGRSELEAIRQIHGLVNEPETTSAGYNSLAFDDEFLRFSFYRNLLPPYTHQWKDGCSRLDLYPIAVLYYLRESEALTWPDGENGVRLRLEDLIARNDLTEGTPHSALADAEATWRLARRFAREEDRWERAVRHFDKRWDERHYEQLETFTIGGVERPVGLLVGGKYGADRGFRRPVLSLGRHEHYGNQTRWMALDAGPFDEWDEELPERARIITKKFGQPDLLFGIREPYSPGLDAERSELANRNLKWLRDHPSAVETLVEQHVQTPYEEAPEIDVDAALYQSDFWSNATERRCHRFHRADGPVAMWEVAEQFDRADLRAIAARILFRNFEAQELPEAVRSERRRYREVLGEPGDEGDAVHRDFRERPRRTPSSVLEEIAQIDRSELEPDQRRLLEELEEYLREHRT